MEAAVAGGFEADPTLLLPPWRRSKEAEGEEDPWSWSSWSSLLLLGPEATLLPDMEEVVMPVVNG